MAIVSTVAKAQIAVSSVTRKRGVRNVVEQISLPQSPYAIAPTRGPQNLKLIILRITRTPISIQHALAAIMKLPVRVSNSGMM